jgi:2-amino-4-hydroxy-6-hydroxymethyldihydropteridine diphosphokinase
MNKVYLLIGGNMGDRLANIHRAWIEIEMQIGAIIQKSAIYETEAWGLKEQPSFYNQAICAQTHFNPKSLLEQLVKIEASMGRQRDITWGPRTMDLDIIYFNHEIVSIDQLSIPHPRMHQRNFVLTPLVEIAPDYIHPVLGLTTTQLLKDCEDKSLVYKKTEE